MGQVETAEQQVLLDELKEFPQIDVPRDPNDPEFCVSFTYDQIEEYQKVI
jgi:hypothetical protein